MAPSTGHEFVVVAHRLPVEHDPTGRGAPWRPSPGGGLHAALQPVVAARLGAWVGWSGLSDVTVEPLLFERMSLYPVGLSSQELHDHLDGQCHATIAPLYHDAVQRPAFHPRWRAAYQEVNRRYARAAAEVAAPGGVVWVHDYHLQLVPGMLRELRPDLLIGFFLHVPFPPVELYTQMPLRREIARGLLGADVIGFQRPRAVGNFLALTRDLLGLSPADGRVPVDGRQVLVTASALSIDVDEVTRTAADPDVVAHAHAIRAELGDPRTVLLAVDRLDPAKGVEHLLTAYAELLAERRLDPDAVVLVQVTAPGPRSSPEHLRLREVVERRIGEINGMYAQVGRPVVHYLHRYLDRRDLVALYLAADVMLATPLRAGVSLAAKEYVAARLDDSGALVLSEFTGTATDLSQAFVVNPHDIDALKDAVTSAVTTPRRILHRSMHTMREHLRHHDLSHWAGRFLATLGGCATASRDAGDGSRPGAPDGQLDPGTEPISLGA